MKTFEDEVRGVVQRTKNPGYDKDHALRLYVEQGDHGRAVRGRYRTL